MRRWSRREELLPQESDDVIGHCDVAETEEAS